VPSITRKPSAAEDRRRAVEGQVFEAVGRLLAEGESFTELSVQRILDAADVARSTFYAHFRDKSDLLQRFADRLQKDLCVEGAFLLWFQCIPGTINTQALCHKYLAEHKTFFQEGTVLIVRQRTENRYG